MPVSVEEVLKAARARCATLSSETAGYLVLAASDRLTHAVGLVDPKSVTLTEDGSVTVGGLGSGTADQTEAGLRALLAELLRHTPPGAPALARVAAAEPRGLARLVTELEAGLIPVNRAAARRALSRLHRDVARARTNGVLDAVPARSIALPKSRPVVLETAQQEPVISHVKAAPPAVVSEEGAPSSPATTAADARGASEEPAFVEEADDCLAILPLQTPVVSEVSSHAVPAEPVAEIVEPDAPARLAEGAPLATSLQESLPVFPDAPSFTPALPEAREHSTYEPEATPFLGGWPAVAPGVVEAYVPPIEHDTDPMARVAPVDALPEPVPSDEPTRPLFGFGGRVTAVGPMAATPEHSFPVSVAVASIRVMEPVESGAASQPFTAEPAVRATPEPAEVVASEAPAIANEMPSAEMAAPAAPSITEVAEVVASEAPAIADEMPSAEMAAPAAPSTELAEVVAPEAPVIAEEMPPVAAAEVDVALPEAPAVAGEPAPATAEVEVAAPECAIREERELEGDEIARALAEAPDEGEVAWDSSPSAVVSAASHEAESAPELPVEPTETASSQDGADEIHAMGEAWEDADEPPDLDALAAALEAESIVPPIAREWEPPSDPAPVLFDEFFAEASVPSPFVVVEDATSAEPSAAPAPLAGVEAIHDLSFQPPPVSTVEVVPAPEPSPPPKPFEPEPYVPRRSDVSELLSGFAVAESRSLKEISRELKQIAGVAATPAPPGAVSAAGAANLGGERSLRPR